jgi:hypothetical protein
MTKSQERAVARVRRMIIDAAFLDLDRDAREISPEQEAASKYEFESYKVEDHGSFVSVTARTRTKDPRTVGHILGAYFFCFIGKRGAIRQMNSTKKSKKGKTIRVGGRRGRVVRRGGYLTRES